MTGFEDYVLGGWCSVVVNKKRIEIEGRRAKIKGWMIIDELLMKRCMLVSVSVSGVFEIGGWIH